MSRYVLKIIKKCEQMHFSRIPGFRKFFVEVDCTQWVRCWHHRIGVGSQWTLFCVVSEPWIHLDMHQPEVIILQSAMGDRQVTQPLGSNESHMFWIFVASLVVRCFCMVAYYHHCVRCFVIIELLVDY